MSEVSISHEWEDDQWQSCCVIKRHAHKTKNVGVVKVFHDDTLGYEVLNIVASYCKKSADLYTHIETHMHGLHFTVLMATTISSDSR